MPLPILNYDHTKLLGVTIDSRLSFAEHVNDIVSKTSFKLFTMRQLRRIGANGKCLMASYDVFFALTSSQLSHMLHQPGPRSSPMAALRN